MVMVNEFREQDIQNEKERKQVHQEILIKSTTSYEKDFKNLIKLINIAVPHKLIETKSIE
jgi:glycerol-3-phosphate dehydrogenase